MDFPLASLSAVEETWIFGLDCVCSFPTNLGRMNPSVLGLCLYLKQACKDWALQA